MARSDYRLVSAQGEVFIEPPQPQTGHRPVIYCHGAGSKALGAKGSNGYGTATVLEAVANLGFTILAADLGATEANFGNAEAMAAMDAAYDRLVSLGAIADGEQVHLMGTSMGNVTQTRWAAANPEKVACMVGVISAFDLEAARDEDETNRALIDAAWDVTWPEPLPAGANPADLLDDLEGIDWTGWYSSNDLPSLVEGSQVLAAALGGPAVSLGALGHADAARAAVPPREVAEFFAAHD